MTNASQPTLEEIQTAMKHSGYLMEQEVATILENLDLQVETNKAFQDVEEGKSRETDVHSCTLEYKDDVNQIALYFDLICECKNTSNPYVFITRQKNGSERYNNPEEFIFSHQTYNESYKKGDYSYIRSIPAMIHLELEKYHYRFISDKKAVQFAKIQRDGAKWNANHAGLYDAIFYPMAKAVIARKKEIKEFSTAPWSYNWFLFPIIVTSGEMYLINSSDTNPTPAPIDSISFTRHIKSDKIDGHYSIDFVRIKSLNEFIKSNIFPFLDHVKALMTEKPNLFKIN